MVTPAAEREAVAHLTTEHEMSERRACQILSCCRVTIRYVSVRADDAERKKFQRKLASTLATGPMNCWPSGIP